MPLVKRFAVRSLTLAAFAAAAACSIGSTPRTDASADLPVDTPRTAPDATDISAETSPDAANDSFFPFPDAMRPPETLFSCMFFSPASGGGCVCDGAKDGHSYQVNCPGGTQMCSCAVDGVVTKMIPNPSGGCRDTKAAAQECGFP